MQLQTFITAPSSNFPNKHCNIVFSATIMAKNCIAQIPVSLACRAYIPTSPSPIIVLFLRKLLIWLRLYLQFPNKNFSLLWLRRLECVFSRSHELQSGLQVERKSAGQTWSEAGSDEFPGGLGPARLRGQDRLTAAWRRAAGRASAQVETSPHKPPLLVHLRPPSRGRASRNRRQDLPESIMAGRRAAGPTVVSLPPRSSGGQERVSGSVGDNSAERLVPPVSGGEHGRRSHDDVRCRP